MSRDAHTTPAHTQTYLHTGFILVQAITSCAMLPTTYPATGADGTDIHIYLYTHTHTHTHTFPQSFPPIVFNLLILVN